MLEACLSILYLICGRCYGVDGNYDVLPIFQIMILLQ